MPIRSKLLLSGLVWVAAFIRFRGLFANRFHLDEALFSSWARLIAVWQDPLLVTQTIDKPPLIMYLQAFFFPLVGPVEWAARLPNFLASMLLVPLAALLAWRLYHEAGTAVLAALLIVLSPLSIQYSATAFTDPLLVALLVLALLLASGQSRPALSGLFMGLAIATKFQAWLFVPLLVGLTWLQGWSWRQWGRWLAGFFSALFALSLWEVSRRGSPVLWSNQIVNFGGVRAAWSWEISPRLWGWARILHLSVGSQILVGLALLAVIVLWIHANRRRDKSGSMDKMLILFVLAYLIIHWLLAVPIWDRYLLPLVPLFSIVLARAVTVSCVWTSDRIGRYRKRQGQSKVQIGVVSMLVGIILLSQSQNVIMARNGQWPIGGQPTADQGAWQVAQYLAKEPYGTVLYDHWYSWQWRYHLFDKGVYVSWFPHAKALAEDISVFGDSGGDRYLVLPATATSRPVHRALAAAGYRLQPVLQTNYQPGMILYQIER
jgi:4-amino-4-deoxy-L-arabinose transferase-like glycosyltransferase